MPPIQVDIEKQEITTQAVQPVFIEKKKAVLDQLRSKFPKAEVECLILDDLPRWYWKLYLQNDFSERYLNDYVGVLQKSFARFPIAFTPFSKKINSIMSTYQSVRERVFLNLRDNDIPSEEIEFRKTFLVKTHQAFSEVQALQIAKRAYALFSAEYWALEQLYAQVPVCIPCTSVLEEKRYAYAERIIKPTTRITRISLYT